MALFEYHATDSAGAVVRGQVTAIDDATARRELASRGLTLVDLFWRPAADSAGTLCEESINTLADSIEAAARNRVPLDVTLAALAEEKGDSRLANVAQRLGNELREGASIDQAIARLGKDLPADVANMLRAGVDSGNLASTMQQLAEQRLVSQRNARSIRAAIAYPLLIVAILVPLLLFLSTWIIPVFGELFEEFDLDLPAITKLSLQASKQLPGLILGLFLLALVLPLMLRFVGGRWLFHRVRAALPLLGPVWTYAGQREFAAMLASFLDLRLPLGQAVSHTGDVLSDRNLGRACRRVTERLDSGQALSRSLADSMHFDRSLVALVAWGERHGLLPQALRLAEEVFADRVEQQASFLRRLLPPVTFVTVAMVLGFVIISLMVPLVKLIEGLSM